MKIVKRIDFVKLSANTVFSEYEPCIFGPLMIKGDTLPNGNDWFEQSIADAICASDSSKFGDVTLRKPQVYHRPLGGGHE